MALWSTIPPARVTIRETQASLRVSTLRSSLFCALPTESMPSTSAPSSTSGNFPRRRNRLASATAQVRQAFDHVSSKRVFYGNSMQLLEQNSTFLGNNKVELSREWSSLVAVDPTDAASQLVNAQEAHDRTIAGAAKVSQLSLLDLLNH